MCSFLLPESQFSHLRNGRGEDARGAPHPAVTLVPVSDVIPQEAALILHHPARLWGVFVPCWEANHGGKKGLVGFWSRYPQVTPRCPGDACQRSGEFPSGDDSAL